MHTIFREAISLNLSFSKLFYFIHCSKFSSGENLRTREISHFSQVRNSHQMRRREISHFSHFSHFSPGEKCWTYVRNVRNLIWARTCLTILTSTSTLHFKIFFSRTQSQHKSFAARSVESRQKSTYIVRERGSHRIFSTLLANIRTRYLQLATRSK